MFKDEGGDKLSGKPSASRSEKQKARAKERRLWGILTIEPHRRQMGKKKITKSAE